MEKYIIKQWDKNNRKFAKILAKTPIDYFSRKSGDGYLSLIKLIIPHILNNGGDILFSDKTEKIKYLTRIERIYHVLRSDNNIWVIDLCHGSCAECDTLDFITEYDWEWDKSIDVKYPSEEQIKMLMLLSLYIVQQLKPFNSIDDALNYKREYMQYMVRGYGEHIKSYCKRRDISMIEGFTTLSKPLRKRILFIHKLKKE